MRGNPGRIIQMPSGAFGIVYNKQPLMDNKQLPENKMIIHLIDADFKPLPSEINPVKQATLHMHESTFKILMEKSKLIGLID